MEKKSLKCPTCGQPVTQLEQVFTCRDHGEWVLYGTSLLVRKPNAGETAAREIMPWEKPVLRAA